MTAQARERLSFVLPGEKAFRVVDPETVPDTRARRRRPRDRRWTPGSTLPWYATVWESVEVAGETPVPGAEDAATPGDNGTPAPPAGG